MNRGTERTDKKLYIVASEPGSGKSLVTIGLLHAFQGLFPKVGYMKPIGQSDSETERADDGAMLVRDIYGLAEDPAVINPGGLYDAQTDRHRLFERILEAYGRLAVGKDVVLFEGTDCTSTASAVELDINAWVVHNLLAPVLLVASGTGKKLDRLAHDIAETAAALAVANVKVIGAVVHGLESESFSRGTQTLGALLAERNISFYGAVPLHPQISKPRLREVASLLKAETVFQGDDLSKIVTDVQILDNNLEHALGNLGDVDGSLLIIPGEREDNLLAALSAQRSAFYPNSAGVILTGGVLPGPHVRKLLKGQMDVELTVLSVPDETYATALKVNEVSAGLKDDPEKVETVQQLVAAHVDAKRICEHVGAPATGSVTPPMFQYRLLEMAKVHKRRILLPEGTEPRILQAASEILSRGVCDLSLLGNGEKIRAMSRSLGNALEGATIIDPGEMDEEVLERYARILYELRKHKGLSLRMARELVLDPVYVATMMVQAGEADGLVSGSTHSTADTLGPVLRVIGTKRGVSLASSVFFMCFPEEVVVYGDCALITNPTAKEMAEIAIMSAETADRFGIEPRIAMLSYSTGESGKGEDVNKVREATRRVRERRPDLPIDGPIQYDAAASEDVARVKGIDSVVAGRATVYIFPDLDAGNTAYKAVQRAADVPAIGPVVQGLNKPANDLSRGATVTDIVYTVAITALQA